MFLGIRADGLEYSIPLNANFYCTLELMFGILSSSVSPNASHVGRAVYSNAMTFGYMEIVTNHVALVERGRPPADGKKAPWLSFSIFDLSF